MVIGFGRTGFFSHPSEGSGKNVMIFGVDMSSTTQTDNRRKDILILGKGPAQGLEYTLSSEKMYSINFTNFTNGANNYLFVNGKEIHKFTAKDLEINSYELSLANISKDCSADNIKETGLKGYVYDFSGHYDAISVSDITDIYKYLMEKNKIKQYV